MRILSRLVMLVLVAAPILAVASAAGADVISPPGSCTVVGLWKKGGLADRGVDHKSSDVINIPRHDIVGWKGTVEDGKLGKKTSSHRDISGEVDISLPLGQSLKVDTWDETTVKTANKGRHGYNLPSFFTGVKFKLTGHHDENGQQVCSGSVYVKVNGGGTSNPLLWASIVGIVVGLGGLLLGGRQVVESGDPLVENSAATPKGHGRRVLGAIGGFILGGSVGALLLPLAVLPLDSVVLLLLPLVGRWPGSPSPGGRPIGKRA